MIKTVYVDVLMCVNLIINYCIILAVARYMKAEPKRWRLILGSFFGAITALLIFLPEIHILINIFLKLSVATVIVFITFGYKNLFTLLKTIGMFFMMSFCFCGIMIAVWFIFTPKGMVIHNSVVYFNISPIIMIVSSVVCYFLLRVISKLSGRETPAQEICKIKIINNGTYAEFYGKLDTGNTLTEPFSQAPVIVADPKIIDSLLPSELKENIFAATAQGSNYNENTILKTDIRFVPFHSIGGTGILPAFIPDELYINNELCEKKVYVAVCKEGRLNGVCKAMINAELANL